MKPIASHCSGRDFCTRRMRDQQADDQRDELRDERDLEGDLERAQQQPGLSQTTDQSNV